MRSYRTFGPLGLIVLVFGLLAGFLTGDWRSLYVLAHVILGGMMLGLYLFTHVDTLRESLGGRQARYGTNAAVYTVMTIAVIGILNYLAVQHPQRWDLTEQKIFSLAPQSTQILDELDEPVTVRAFYREGEEGAARDLLAAYAAASERFHYEFIDPDKHPELAEQYDISEYGTVHVSIGEQSAKIDDLTEESLTNTLIRLGSARRKRVYFVLGHGEPDLEQQDQEFAYTQAKAALDNEGYDLVPLVLGSVPDVPADADLLILAGPQRPLLERELDVLDRYLDRGGHALLMIDPRSGEELRPLLAERGVRLGDDVIVEQFIQLFAGATLGLEPIVADYGTHPITEGFKQRTIFRMARSVNAVDDPPTGVTVTELVRTSEASWAETDLQRLFDTGEVALDDADTPGPVPIAVAVTLSKEALHWSKPAIATLPAPDDEGAEQERGGDGSSAAAGADDAVPDQPPADLEGRLVVFGDSMWATNRYLGNYYNRDLLLNVVGWLAGQEELISIRPRHTRASRVMLTQRESQTVFYLTVLLLPELILFCGMIIWLGRRYR